MPQDLKIPSRRASFHDALGNEHVTSVLDFLQRAWEGKITFEEFDAEIMEEIEGCQGDFPQFKCVQQLGDISTMNEEDWEHNRKLEVGKLTTNFGAILAGGCSRCGRKALSIRTVSLGCFEGDHDQETGTKTDGPSTIAIKKGPYAWRDEVFEGQIDMKCIWCHRKDDQSHPQRGQDNPEKDVCFLHQRRYNREDRRSFHVSQYENEKQTLLIWI